MILEKITQFNLLTFLKSNKYAIISFIYFTILAYLLRQSLNESLLDKSLFCNVSLAVLNSVIIQGFLGLVSRTGKLRFVLIFLLSLIITVDMTHYFAFGTVISLGGISSILETNASESFDAIKMLFPIALPILLLNVLVMIFVVKELKSKKRVIFKSVIGICISFVFISAFFYTMMDGYRGRLLGDFKSAPLLASQRHLAALSPLVINTNVCTITYLNEMYKFRQDIAKPKTLPTGVLKIADAKLPNTVIVLIGESSFRDHYSLYGYDLPTSPFLDSLSQTSQMSYFTAVSPAAITRDALRQLLTFSSPANSVPFAENKNIVTLANDAGYDTYWISNQNKVGMNDSYVGLISSYSKNSTFYDFEKDDLELIDIVDELYSPSQKQIFFVHLKGSHLNYDTKFDKEDEAKLPIPVGREYTGSYDRSIHHTDRVLEKSYKRLFAKDTLNSKLLYYFSDHGEIINSGHGFRENKQLMDQFKVPFISIYQNPVDNQDSITAKYMNNGIFNTCNFSYVFSESIGYSVSESVAKQAKKEGLDYLHVDGLVYRFNELEIK